MDFGRIKSLIIFIACALVALVVGYSLSDPLDLSSMLFLSLLVGVFSFPILLNWHHQLLIASWNAAAVVFFLPGQLPIGIVMAFASIAMVVLTSTMSKHGQFINVPSLTWPLLFLTFVFVATAALTGGIGLRLLGASSFGGRRMIYLLAAISGYFALTSKRIPRNEGVFFVSLFFLSGTTSAISNIVYFLGNGLNFLFLPFPLQITGGEVNARLGESLDMLRLVGLAFAAHFFICFLLVRYGVAGIFSFQSVWRPIVFFLAMIGVMLGGFRSVFGLVGLLLIIQFFLEGLYRTRLLPVVLAALVLLGMFVVFFGESLPLSVQRALSFLPVKIDPIARYNATATTEWRLDMWSQLWPQVPGYLALGKGFSIDPNDIFLAWEAQRSGFVKDWEVALVVGNYHNGPLSVLIPFGLAGAVGFVWFLVVGCRILYQNYRNGLPELRTANTFLFALFFARILTFTFVYGALDIDLLYFTGLVGLGVSLNGGVVKKPKAGRESHFVPIREGGVQRKSLQEVMVGSNQV